MKKGWGCLRHGLKTGLRRQLRWAWIYALYYTGLLRWARRRISSRSGIIVLTFHRVLEDSGLRQTDSPAGMIVRRETFEHLLRFLQENCEVVDLLSPPIFGTTANGYPRIAITFDDGWKDTAEAAFPLAQRHQLPFTVFLCPDLVGQPVPFWPEKVLRTWRKAVACPAEQQRLATIFARFSLSEKTEPVSRVVGEQLVARLKGLPAEERQKVVAEVTNGQRVAASRSPQDGIDATMNWEDVTRLSSQQIAIGSHTVNHELLTTLPNPQADREIRDAKQKIENRVHCECRLFAYPNGSWSPQIRQLVEQAGYTHAFSNQPGVWTTSTDACLIPRVNIWEGSVVGPSGRFSPVVFEYAVFWKSHRAETRN